jgi:hypothetical protein
MQTQYHTHLTMGLTKRNSNRLSRLGFGLRDTPTVSAGGFVVDVSI